MTDVITRDDGLTDAEGIVADAALAVVNGYAKLPVQHPNDMRDICDAVHRVQDMLAVRIARRAFPLGWPIKTDSEAAPWTYVLAVDRRKAADWCRANDIPLCHPTRIIEPDTSKGRMVRDQDRVVFVGDVESRPDWARLWAALAPCLLNVGPDKIERVPEAES